MHVTPGTLLLGKYRVDRVLGAGGMGMVVAATHLHLQERVAIKFLLPEVLANHEVVHRFLREAQAAVRLKGEHVARVIDVGTLPDGVPYIVMEYLDGRDLAALIAHRGPLPPGEAVDYLLQACEAMAEAHALGIVHRDIKPANFFLSARPDGSPLLKVLDFGISKMPVELDSSLTRTQAVMGTPSYMSPEQMRSSRDVDARSDIWSMGAVLYECLSGRRPFEAETFSALCLQAAMDPPPPIAVPLPRGLDQIVYRCLDKDASARFASVAELAVALAPYAANPRAAATVVERTRAMGTARGTSAPSAAVATSSPTTLGSAASVRTPRRRAGLAVGGVLVAVAGVAVVAALVLGDRGRPTDSPVVAAPPPPALDVPAAAPPEPPPPAPPAEATASAPPAAEPRVIIQFMVSPPSAKSEIWVDGVQLDGTDIEVAPSRTRRLDVKIVAAGFETYRSQPLPVSSLAIPVELVPIATRTKPRPLPKDRDPRPTPRVKRVDDL